MTQISPAQKSIMTVQEEENILLQEIKVGGIYQHYKGHQYKVLVVSRHTEDLTWYVVYEALYDNAVSKIWHRPIKMFLETVDIEGNTMPRFKLVS